MHTDVENVAVDLKIYTMLESLITSKTRVKLLLKLFLNSSTTSHLRGLQKEFGESSNSIRLELNRLIEADLLTSENIKNRKYYKANTSHPLFNDINSILRKMVGIDKIVERITSQIGNLDAAYLTGEFASGRDSDTIELALIGENLDRDYIKNLVNKAEELVGRKIVSLILTSEQMEHFLKDKPILLIWKKDE